MPAAPAAVVNNSEWKEIGAYRKSLRVHNCGHYACKEEKKWDLRRKTMQRKINCPVHKILMHFTNTQKDFLDR